MFSFLKTGDIHNSIRGLTNLPGLFTSDGDKIKYAILNYSTAMRKNLSDGLHVFAGILKTDSSADLDETHDINYSIDRAALAFIMAKELTFLNRTIQMITLIANRYQEEQDDLNWGRSSSMRSEDDHDDHDHDHDDVVSPPVEDLEQGYEDDTTSSVLLRSHSHPTNEYADGASARSCTSNQLAATFLIASGHLIERFNHLCALIETSAVLVNGMTTMDRPHNEVNRERQLAAQSLVISDIFLHFKKCGDAAAAAFLELRDISVYAWKIMSMFAFSNLFRLTAGTEFAMCYQPEDAIFTQGRDYRLQPTVLEHCCVGANLWEEATETTEADAEADAVSARCGRCCHDNKR
jgi:hypothetical protein